MSISQSLSKSESNSSKQSDGMKLNLKQSLMTHAQITFELFCETFLDEQIRIVGNIPQLGSWNPEKGLILKTDQQSYPNWTTEQVLYLHKSIKIQFKFLKFCNGQVKEWENFPNNYNRKYRTRYNQVSLKARWNDFEGKEVVQKKFISSVYIQDKEPTVHREKKSGVFNPFDKAEQSDSSSSGRSNDLMESEEITFNFNDGVRKRRRSDYSNQQSQISSSNCSNSKSSSTPATRIKEIDLETEKDEEFNSEEEEKSQQVETNSLDKLFQQKMEKFHKKLPKFSFLESVNDIIYETSTEFLVNLSEHDNITIASLFLPLSVKYFESNEEWKIEINQNHPLYYFFQAFPNSKWVGLLQNYEEIDPSAYDEIKKLLEQNYNCYPIFFDNYIIDNFLKKLCFYLLDPIMNNSFDITKFSFQNYSEELQEISKNICLNFAKKINKVSNENSHIYILDPRILLTITYINAMIAKPSTLIFFDKQFPCFDKLKIIPNYEDYINALLGADIICFIEFQPARQFFSIIQQMHGVKFYSRRGNIQLNYMGRNIIVKIKHPGINMKTINNEIEKFQYQYQLIQKTLQTDFKNNLVLIGVDYLLDSSQIQLKLKLFKALLQKYQDKNLLLIQICYNNKEVQDEASSTTSLEEQLDVLQDQINREYPDSVMLMIENMPLWKRLAYMSVANIFFNTSINQENVAYPFEYVAVNCNKAISLISNFSTSFRSFQTQFRFNIYSYAEFFWKFDQILNLKVERADQMKSADLNYIKLNSTMNWIESSLAELKKNARFMTFANITGVGDGTQFKKVAHSFNYKKLFIKNCVDSYLKSNHRMLLLGYVGTLVGDNKYTYVQYSDNIIKRFYQKPSDSILRSLTMLTSDPKNTIYLITELTTEFVDQWFQDITNLGLACENGYMHKVIRPNGDDDWKRLSNMDMSWKEKVIKLMDQFILKTPGSYKEVREVSILWKYNNVQEQFGTKQAEVLQELLKELLVNKDIEIHLGRHFIEVRPLGLNKGTIADLLIQQKYYEHGKIDWLMALGYGLSNEDMFASIKNLQKNNSEFFVERSQSFTVSVGIKPSNANQYLKDYTEVEILLENLANCEQK